jgi:hypothetical protein
MSHDGRFGSGQYRHAFDIINGDIASDLVVGTVQRSIKGVSDEWHLLNLLGMTMFSDVRSGYLAWFGE